MFLAEKKGVPPKDLGLDLLVLKEKRWVEEEYNKDIEAGVQHLGRHKDVGTIDGGMIAGVDKGNCPAEGI